MLIFWEYNTFPGLVFREYDWKLNQNGPLNFLYVLIYGNNITLMVITNAMRKDFL